MQPTLQRMQSDEFLDTQPFTLENTVEEVPLDKLYVTEV